MTDILDAKDYFKKLKQAEAYCQGDVELAKKLLSGDFKDSLVFKGRFKDVDDKIYGLFIVVINKLFFKILTADAIVSGMASIYRHKPLEEWEVFLSKLEKEKSEAEFDKDLSEQLKNTMRRLLEITGVESIVFMAENNNITELTDQFRSITSDVLAMNNIQLMIDFDYTTSIEISDKTGLSPE